MQRVKNKMKYGCQLFLFGILLMLCPVFCTQAAENDSASTVPMLIYVTYDGDTVKVGDTIDREKITVTAVFQDGSTEEVENYALSTNKVLADGVNNVVAIYKGKSSVFTVIGKKAVSLYADYSGGSVSVGNRIGKDDVSVFVYYSDGSMETVTDYTLGNSVITSVGYRQVTAIYQGLKATFLVQGVATRPLQSLVATYTGDKIIEGNAIDSEDVYVMAVYTDATTERIYNYGMQSSVVKKVGMNTLAVIYQGKLATFEVEGVARTIESISAKYTGSSMGVGQYIDKTKVSVKAKYNDGTEEEVTEFTLMPERIYALGDNAITVDYEGLRAYFEIVGIESSADNYDNVSKFTVTNGKKKATVEIALPLIMESTTLSGKSLKQNRVTKVLGKVNAQETDFIAFDVILADETQDDIFPLTMRISLPTGYTLDDTNVYYTSNRKSVIAKMNVERLKTRKLELTIFHPGTYILVYQEPKEIEEDEKEEKESDYLD